MVKNHLFYFQSMAQILLPLPKAILFDMDGTLVDNMHFHHIAWMRFIEEKKLNIDAETFERDYHKGTLIEVMARFFPHLKTEATLRKVGNEKEALFREIYRPHIKPINGLLQFLDRLKEKNIPIGLATMGDQNNINMTLTELGILDYFHSTTGGHEIEKGKPQPDIFLKAAHKIGIAPKDCLAFEDTQSGINSAQVAGMKVVGIATQFSADKLLSLGCCMAIEDYRLIDFV